MINSALLIVAICVALMTWLSGRDRSGQKKPQADACGCATCQQVADFVAAEKLMDEFLTDEQRTRSRRQFADLLISSQSNDK